MKELIFADTGIVIGDRDKHDGISLSYGEMFSIVHQFLNEFYRQDMITSSYGEVQFIQLKEGDASPYPIIVSTGKRTYQLKPIEVIGIKDFCKANVIE